LACGPASEAACVNPSTLVRSAVSITREFDEDERRLEPSSLGIRGTAWFLSRRLIVTAAHVVEAMHLSAQDWKEIEVRGSEEVAIPARTLRVAGSNAEKIAVLELRASLPGAVVLRVRMEPLVPEAHLLSLAYPNGKLRFASGRFAEYGRTDSLDGAALLEMHDGNDRLVLDHGCLGGAGARLRGQSRRGRQHIDHADDRPANRSRAGLHRLADPQRGFPYPSRS
jgi:hypothetical protein